ncbi:MAG TPA: hypothetical protein VLF40_00400 [Candidatus Saccharimonadales bacterium]|nr:hypothetical protein [Candidatus Saccharimonadales bacterium]
MTGRELVPSGIPDTTGVLENLRAAMLAVREHQRAASLDVPEVGYNIETDAINQEFLQGFLDVLPVRLERQRLVSRSVPATQFATAEATDLRWIAAHGVIFTPFENNNGMAGFVIGQRQIQVGKDNYTEILAVGQTEPEEKVPVWFGNSKTYTQERVRRARVYTATVLTKEWQAYTNHTMNSPAIPYDRDLMNDAYVPEMGAFVLEYDGIGPTRNRFGIPTLVPASLPKMGPRINSIADLPAKKPAEALGRGMHANPSVFSCTTPQGRNLRSTDFGEFDVMARLEYIAAAFGAGEAFDTVKARRAEQIPQHPATKVLQLPAYREVIESAIDAAHVTM